MTARAAFADASRSDRRLGKSQVVESAVELRPYLVEHLLAAYQVVCGDDFDAYSSS